MGKPLWHPGVNQHNYGKYEKKATELDPQVIQHGWKMCVPMRGDGIFMDFPLWHPLENHHLFSIGQSTRKIAIFSIANCEFTRPMTDPWQYAMIMVCHLPSTKTPGQC